MGEIINLNRVRKARARDAAAAVAAENRARHGRTKAAKAREADETARAAAVLDSHRVESPESDVPDSSGDEPRRPAG